MLRNKMLWRAFLILACAQAPGIGAIGAQNRPVIYPNEGTLFYDGTRSWVPNDPNDLSAGGEYRYANFADAKRMYWYNPDPSACRDQCTLELDISLREAYYEGCSAYSDIENSYDDCATAGVSDPAGRRNFGYGVFNASQLTYRPYFITWLFYN
jgi:hypothetical protein